MDLTFIQKLEKNLQLALPGEQAQIKMAHPARYQGIPAPPTAVHAGVLALFFPKHEEWNLVFIERVSHNDRDVHKGQISFPGGRFDDGDGDFGYTALREAYEEVGVDPQHITLLGALTDIYIPVSNFHVHPYVGFVDYAPVWQPQEREVASILEIPFKHFFDPAHRKVMDLNVNAGFILTEVPYFDLGGWVLWGATAMIMSELVEVMLLQEMAGF